MANSSNWRVRGPTDTSSQPRESSSSSRRAEEDRSYREERPRRQPIVSFAERKRAEGVMVHRPERQHEDSPETLKAIEEGRRIYLGNLFYTTTPPDINAFLADNGVGSVTNVHISIDAFTGRCPGYCFVEFAEKGNADHAMETLQGLPMFGRPVKCGPCRPKGNVRCRGPSQASRDENTSSNSNRWGNWESSGTKDWKPKRLSEQGGPNDAMSYYQLSKAQEEGRQLYIGGLPRMLDQTENDLEIRAIFRDFAVDGVSKRVSPRENNVGDGRRNFCFVDFTTREEAKAAKDSIDGTFYRDAPLKVSAAIPRSQRQTQQSSREETTVVNSRIRDGEKWH